MTQSDLAKTIGVKANTVSQWMVGKYEPELGQITKIAKAFGVEPHELLIDYTKNTYRSVNQELMPVVPYKHVKATIKEVDAESKRKDENVGSDLENAINLIKTLDDDYLKSVLGFLHKISAHAAFLKKTK